MGTKICTVAILLITAIATIFSTCKKNGIGCTESTYSFEINVQVFPDADSVNIGDTIWIEINSKDVFTDHGSGQQVDFSNANNLGTYIGFVKLVKVSPLQLEGAVSQFKFNLTAGKEEPNRLPVSDTIEKSFIIKDINSRYLFKLGIIPQKSGTFSFNLGNFVGVYRNGNSCPKADFFTKLVQTDQHYYLYPGGSGVTPAGADYYFYVR